MSLRPIDFNGMMQNTQELSITRANEEHRPIVQQEVAAQIAQQEVEVSISQVHEQGDTAESDLNPDEGSGNGYQGNRSRKRKKKAEKVPDGTVSIKSGHQSFDMKI